MTAIAAILKTLKKNKSMGVKKILETITANEYWSTNGETPDRTLRTVIVRELAKGRKSAIKKTAPGQFVKR